jgi:hypothetical protein
MKYEVTLKTDFGEPSEICVHTTKGFKNALAAALDSQFGDESGVYEIIIRKVED